MFATSKNEDYYCVCMGAGMGLAFAGDLADICFLDLVERQWLLTESVRAQYNLVCYYRFKDDGFFITDCSKDKLLEFSDLLKRKLGASRSISKQSAMWKCQCWMLSFSGANDGIAPEFSTTAFFRKPPHSGLHCCHHPFTILPSTGHGLLLR